jgi:hypothetical protein
MNRIIRRHFGKQKSKETQLRLHNITTKSALRYGSENWILKQRNKQRLEAAQMKFLRSLLGLTRLDKKRNTEIREQLNVINIVQDIEDYQKQWFEHVKRMQDNRLPKIIMNHKLTGRRDRGRPRTRWRDQLHLQR